MKNYVAIGDLVLDVYLDKSLTLLGYYAGGSVWNDLMNVKYQNDSAHCFGIGTCGNDRAGDFLLEIFDRHGIDMSNIKKTRHQTNRFSVVVDHENTKSQKSCPVCRESVWYSGTSYPKAIPEQFIHDDPGVVIIDSLKQNVLLLANEFRKKGWCVAADIGYINHLRYLSIESIRDLFVDRFDVLQLNERVYRFLTSRLSLQDKTQLFELLNCDYLSITNGAKGSDFLFKDDGVIVCKEIAAKTVDTIDPTGAGDMYFSTLLHSLDEKGRVKGSIGEVLGLAASNAAKRTCQIGGVGLIEKTALIDEGCCICGHIPRIAQKARSKRKQIETNTTHLLDRILRSLESNASNQVKSVLDNIDGTIYMVGTGGSYAAACYAAIVVNQFHKTSRAIACHPRDLLIEGLNKTKAVFLFSYSGSTKDILNVYSMCERCAVPVYLVTKKRTSSFLGLEPTSIISYSNSNSDAKERGFLSMAGTLIPMCVFAEAFIQEKEFSLRAFLMECFRERSEEFSSGIGIELSKITGYLVDIFYERSTSCAALDLESKFIESGVGRVALHEKKDFSHGRFNILDRMPPDFIIILESHQGRYSDKLNEYLDRRNIPTVRIRTKHTGTLGQLELMIATQYFLSAMSKQIDYDMSKPDYPKDAMMLYRYSGKDLY